MPSSASAQSQPEDVCSVRRSSKAAGAGAAGAPVAPAAFNQWREEKLECHRRRVTSQKQGFPSALESKPRPHGFPLKLSGVEQLELRGLGASSTTTEGVLLDSGLKPS